MNITIPWTSKETLKILRYLVASRATRLTDQHPGVRLADVGGMPGAKDQIQEVIGFLCSPKRYQRLRAHLPKDILLSGPSGCGKTLLARALMGESGVPCFHATGAGFIALAMGVGAIRIENTFDLGRANKPAIVFIDDIDAIARRRGDGPASSSELEQHQTLVQLLSEIDSPRAAGVIFVAATNRIDLLDPALIERFDRIIRIDLPDEEERRSIFEVLLRNKTVDESVNATLLAQRTSGFSGAAIRRLINEAALLAVRRDKEMIGMAEFKAKLEGSSPG